MKVTVEIYENENGEMPFLNWLESIKDENSKDVILGRIQRLKLGLFGKWRIIKRNVFELKIDYGQGFRVYYGKRAGTLVLLLIGGTKGSQKKDIKKAVSYWEEFSQRNKKDGRKKNQLYRVPRKEA